MGRGGVGGGSSGSRGEQQVGLMQGGTLLPPYSVMSALGCMFHHMSTCDGRGSAGFLAPEGCGSAVLMYAGCGCASGASCSVP